MRHHKPNKPKGNTKENILLILINQKDETIVPLREWPNPRENKTEYKTQGYIDVRLRNHGSVKVLISSEDHTAEMSRSVGDIICSQIHEDHPCPNARIYPH